VGRREIRAKEICGMTINHKNRFKMNSFPIPTPTHCIPVKERSRKLKVVGFSDIYVMD
jgi:hypothetical protein